MVMNQKTYVAYERSREVTAVRKTHGQMMQNGKEKKGPPFVHASLFFGLQRLILAIFSFFLSSLLFLSFFLSLFSILLLFLFFHTPPPSPPVHLFPSLHFTSLYHYLLLLAFFLTLYTFFFLTLRVQLGHLSRPFFTHTHKTSSRTTTTKTTKKKRYIVMSHSRANNDSADLEHLELTEDVVASSPDESRLDPPPIHIDPRRVSINSVDSTSSNATIKYHPHPTQASEPSSSSYTRPAASLRLSSSGSIASAARRPKSSPSYRHSTAGPPTSTQTSRRRRSHAGRPGSTRSSVRHRNRSSDIEEETSENDSDDRVETRSSYSNLRRGDSRRSVRLHTEDEADGRSFDEQGRYSAGGHSGDDHDDDDESDIEPVTLKDRQEVCLSIIFCY